MLRKKPNTFARVIGHACWPTWHCRTWNLPDCYSGSQATASSPASATHLDSFAADVPFSRQMELRGVSFGRGSL